MCVNIGKLGAKAQKSLPEPLMILVEWNQISVEFKPKYIFY